MKETPKPISPVWEHRIVPGVAESRRRPGRSKQMDEREQLTAAEIEALCVNALSKLPGLETIQYAKIRTYEGDGDYTWELEADPSSGALALAGAEPVIRELQSEFDLKT
jgi:hypothetical protein